MGRASRRKRERPPSPRADLARTAGRLRGYEEALDLLVPGWMGGMERLRASARAEVDWAPWCLAPMAAAHAVVSARVDDPEVAGLTVSRVAALHAWAFGRTIWRFDPALAAALAATELDGRLPVEILERLPVWCAYVLAPEGGVMPEGCLGFFAHLEHDANDGRQELRLLFDFGDFESLLGVPLHLSASPTLAGALEAAGAEAQRQWARRAAWGPAPAGLGFAGTLPLVRPAVALLLYLASEGADVVDPDHPDAPRPGRAAAPSGRDEPPRWWEAGYRVGTALRAAAGRQGRRGGGPAERGAPAAHLRRAHWHLYWTGEGSRSDPAKRAPVVRWVHPVLVGAGDAAPVFRDARRPGRP